jgi:predicted alpha/beta hydrolase family esterase
LKANVLILPGIGNSGPTHWQSLWEASHPSFRRVLQRDWDNPVCSEWVAALEREASAAGPSAVLVAHSLACLVVAHWSNSTVLRIRGALLAAVPDTEGSDFPKEASGFSPVPWKSFPFPSIVVASMNDPYGSLDYAQCCAKRWGSRFVNIGAAGHINAASGLGVWPEGFALVRELLG